MDQIYIDLICIEINKISKDIIALLKSIKSKHLKTKSLIILPNKQNFKETMLSYGCDDYISKPYDNEDLILRCKNLINCIPTKYEKTYESQFLKYSRKFNIVTYNNTYLPLTPNEILLLKLLIREKFLNKKELCKYFSTKLHKDYSEGYFTVLIHRVRKKIKLCTGLDLIKNKYGRGYYIL